MADRKRPHLAIAGRTIGGDAPALIVAEIGTSHGGDPLRAEELVAAAADAGADCAKFQLVLADEIIHPKTGSVPLPGGSIPLYERFRELERDLDFYRMLKEKTERAGLLFLCTPFGLRSAAMLHELGVQAFKIASPELNHYPLIRLIAGYAKPLVLSTGVSLLADIERAVQIAGEHAALLHCVTSYPAPEEDYNLRLLPALESMFGLPVGVSDHSLHSTLVPQAAVALGAAIVEKHITLSRTDPGLDDPVALPPAEFRAMATAIRCVEAEGKSEAFARLSRVFGSERLEAVLGSGRKRLAPSERANYGRTNRSIHALSFIPAGARLTEDAVALLRTEKILRPGLSPEFLPLVIGRQVVRDVPEGEGIVWDDLLP